jgi:hypothetical protein
MVEHVARRGKKKYLYIVMRRLTTGYVLGNASLDDFVVVRTS